MSYESKDEETDDLQVETLAAIYDVLNKYGSFNVNSYEVDNDEKTCRITIVSNTTDTKYCHFMEHSGKIELFDLVELDNWMKRFVYDRDLYHARPKVKGTR